MPEETGPVKTGPEDTGRAAEPHTEKPEVASVDPEAVRASIRRLMDIYRLISETADKASITRCPYKDARSRCTAKFKCRNQHWIPGKPGEAAICVGSDKLDYRKAWQND